MAYGAEVHLKKSIGQISRLLCFLYGSLRACTSYHRYFFLFLLYISLLGFFISLIKCSTPFIHYETRSFCFPYQWHFQMAVANIILECGVKPSLIYSLGCQSLFLIWHTCIVRHASSYWVINSVTGEFYPVGLYFVSFNVYTIRTAVLSLTDECLEHVLKPHDEL